MNPPQTQQEPLYCFCQSPGNDERYMIQCCYCSEWFHLDCLDSSLTQDEAMNLLEFFCPICQVFVDSSRLVRDQSQVNYKEYQESSGHELKWTRILCSRRFTKSCFPIVKGAAMTKEYAIQTGFKEPLIVLVPEGLQMKMPPSSLTVRQVAELCGKDRKVNVLQVSTQSDLVMSLKDWADYFELPLQKRKKILNVISLEISDSKLALQVTRPLFVRELDWIDHVWPTEIRPKEYPQVQLYCLMSVKNSFTDFHIDFGGSSVFYHLLSGQKIFYFIRPTCKNLKLYENWSSSPNQSSRFFADEVDECYKVNLYPGNTMFIPTGWIHAVFTPKDSIVIGGNFLHGFDIPGQLRIYAIENATNVPLKFRFPYYERMQWYALKKYVLDLTNGISLSGFELSSLLVLMKFLSNSTFECPIDDSLQLLNDAKKLLPEDFDVDVPSSSSSYMETLVGYVKKNNDFISQDISNHDLSSNETIHKVLGLEIKQKDLGTKKEIIIKKEIPKSQSKSKIVKQKSVFSRLSKVIRKLKK